MVDSLSSGSAREGETFQASLASAERIFTLFDQPMDNLSGHKLISRRLQGRVELKNIHFKKGFGQYRHWEDKHLLPYASLLGGCRHPVQPVLPRRPDPQP